MDILTPEDHDKEAKQAYQQGDFETAAEQFAAAAEAYQAQDNTVMTAEMRNNQSVALVQAGQGQPALDALEGTQQIFESAGETLKAAMSIGNRAAALEALGKLKEAEEAYKQCAEALKELGESNLRADVMQSISRLQMRTGRQVEALANMQDGLDGVERPNLRQRFLKRLLKIPSKLLGQ
jgi:tetratricopeptide (TPR) repeat protein